MSAMSLWFSILSISNATAQNHNSDSVTYLINQNRSYELSGEHLKTISEKILFKKTPQEDLYLYLLRPNGNSRSALPAIIYFVGGGWVNGDVEYEIPNAAWFRDNGIIGITADYRVKSRHGTTPLECIADGKSAVRFVRYHAKQLGIDPGKIIVAGGSAGGHIALCTLLEGGDEPGESMTISTKPNVLILHNPVLGEGSGESFFKTHPEFSPILNVRKGWPPTILSNGTNDSITPFHTAETFAKRMEKNGNVCQLIAVEGAGHSCDWPVSNPNFLPTMVQMTQFLAQQGIISKQQLLFPSIAPDSLFPPDRYAPGNVIEWSKNHYREKVTEFKRKPIGNDKIVMVGNSLTEGGKDWAKRLNSGSVVNRGISGDVAEGVLMRIDEICFYKPKAVFLLIGINDLNGGGKGPIEVYEEILLVIKRINHLSENSKVYVQSLLPTSFPNINQMITQVNHRLKVNENNKSYTFIDLYSRFIDKNGLIQALLTTDGVHLTELGYQVWSNAIQGFVK
jgi:acetyl esterase/lipase/lysophospholipase L1-like esterase